MPVEYNPNKILCDNCKVPIVFQDVKRTYDATLGIYVCPKCHKGYCI